jgi:predicted AAA+ superfamily ATPase
MVGDLKEGAWVILDEVQKVPALLDEVHRMMEDRRWRFALCGSSARKLKRGGANLLAGRASTLSMEGFVSEELGSAYDLEWALQWGTLPLVQAEKGASKEILEAYVSTYLKEELLAEGLIRKAPPFTRFLQVAGALNGQMLNAASLSRDAAVSRSTLDTYLGILTDTLLVHLLPAWRPGFKVREASVPKLYWFDTGVARAAAGLLGQEADRPWLGHALETLIYHELRVHNEASRKNRPIRYYRTNAGVEVDFVVETAARRQSQGAELTAIEVKLSPKWDGSWNKALEGLAKSKGVHRCRKFGVYTGARVLTFGDLRVLPVPVFLEAVHKGEVFG